MRPEECTALDRDLRRLLGLATPPIAIGFPKQAPADLPRPPGPRPQPTADGRTGAAAAGCVFWMAATERSFAVSAAFCCVSTWPGYWARTMRRAPGRQPRAMAAVPTRKSQLRFIILHYHGSGPVQAD